MLSTFKEKLNAQMQSKAANIFPIIRQFSNCNHFSVDQSTTPPGSPPPDLQKSLGLLPKTPTPAVAAAAQNTSSILAALANMARQNTAAPLANNQPRDSSYNVSNAQNTPAPQVAALNQSLPFPPPPVNVPAAAATFASQFQGMSNGAQNLSSNQTNPFAAMPVVPPPPTHLDPTMQQQLLLVKALLDSGVAPDQVPKIMAAMGNGPPMPFPGGLPPPPPQFAAQNQIQNGQNGWVAKPEESRDHNGYQDDPMRSPPGRFRRRSRSRSPQGWNARDSPARRRDEPAFDYERDSPPGRNRGEERGRAGRGGRQNDYRQRSPPRRAKSPSPPKPNGNVNGAGKKWIGHDDTIGQGKIKGMIPRLF